MTSKHGSKLAANVPADADDFKRIRGIGPNIAQRLYMAGIHTFDQLATQSPAGLAELVGDVAGISADLIAKKDWAGQARTLAAELRMAYAPILDQEPAAPLTETTEAAARQHYATFTVELLLDEMNDVRRTRATHIQGGAEEAWAGWQAERLVDFFVRCAVVRSPQVEPTPMVVEVEPARTLVEVAPTPAQPLDKAALHVQALELVPEGADGPHSFLRHDQPFEVGLTLDLADVAAPAGQTLAYRAEIYAKDLRRHARRTIAETQGTLALAEVVALRMRGTDLPSGLYRLEAVVSVAAPGSETGVRKKLTAFQEGGLVQVY